MGADNSEGIGVTELKAAASLVANGSFEIPDGRSLAEGWQLGNGEAGPDAGVMHTTIQGPE